jgi:transposase-like protein
MDKDGDHSRVSEATQKTARSLRYKGLDLWEIAERLGMSTTTVQRVCRDIPVDNRTRGMKRPEWLDEAQARVARGTPRRVVAVELGIPIATFYRAYSRFKDVGATKRGG